MRMRILLEPHHGASYDQILALARTTEEAGFDAFFRSDHYLGIDAEDTSYRPTDSWTTLAGLAVQTERVRLGTLMTASTYRRPGPLAITVATVDAMSGGRAELGIGAAWYEREHRFFGIPFPPLGERFDRLGEQLEVITGLWRTAPGEVFSYHGKHYQLEECASIPRPARTPPVIIGGAGPRRTPALAARFADEFNSGMSDGLADRFANFRRVCREAGRDPGEVRLSTTLPVCCGETRGEAARRAAALGEAGARMLRMGVTGAPGDVAAGWPSCGRPARIPCTSTCTTWRTWTTSGCSAARSCPGWTDFWAERTCDQPARHDPGRRAASVAPAVTTASSPTARPRAAVAPACRTSSAPQAAPANIVATARTRRPSPASPWSLARTSAAMPVSVMVSTVVVRSGTARRRATAFWMPMARASRAARRPGPPRREATPVSRGQAGRQGQRGGHQHQFGRRAGAQQQAAVVAQAAGQRAAEQGPGEEPGQRGQRGAEREPGRAD